MLVFVIKDQPNRPRTHLGRKLVAYLVAHSSTFSAVGASGKPGAVQTVACAHIEHLHPRLRSCECKPFGWVAMVV
jgi:hypothetical protein